MRPTTVLSDALRTSAAVGFALASIAATASAQRNLGDPGRFYREPTMKMKAAKNAGAAYNLFLTPTFGWASNFQQFGGQLKYASNDLITNIPVAFSGSVMENRISGGGLTQSKVSTQLDAEFDVLSKPEYMLALSGQMSHTSNIGTGLEFAPEFDWTLPKNDMFTGAIGGIMYWDQFSPSGSTVSTSGTTLGVLAYLNHGTWGLIPEYDLASDWNGQNGVTSIRVSKAFMNMAHDPRVIFGMRHTSGNDSFVAGARWTMH